APATVASGWSTGAPTTDLSYAARRGPASAPAARGLAPGTGQEQDRDREQDREHLPDPGHGVAAEHVAPERDAATGQVPSRRRRSGP
ncbi:hypothetical protein, partial [Frankia sp. ACN10a]